MLSSKQFTLFALTVFMVSSVGTEESHKKKKNSKELEAKTVVHVHKRRTPTIYDFFFFFFEVHKIQDSQ